MHSFICSICSEEFPVALHHEHHKVPKSLGGSDAPTNLVDLCQTDHQLLHAVAFMIINPKRKHEIEPTLLSVYPGPLGLPVRKKVLEFAGYVAKEMALKKEIKKDEDAETRVTVELPQLYVQLMRLSGYDTPHANGKPTGVGTMLRNVVADYLLRKFPMKKDQIIALRKKKAE